MAKFQADVIIDRPREVVWRFIANYSNLARATPNAPQVRQTSLGALRLGATFSGKDGRLTLEVKVTEFDPNRRLVAEFVKPGFLKGTTDNYSLETVDGRTSLIETWDTMLNGIFRLLGPFFAPRTRKDVSTRLANLKRMLESEA